MTWKLHSLAILVAVVTHCHATIIPRGSLRMYDRNVFMSNVFHAVALENPNDNLVISPAAIRSSLALAYCGAKGQTAAEIKAVLRLSSSDVEEVTRSESEFLDAYTSDTNLQLINSIYINENLELKAAFKEIAVTNFSSSVEKADFHPPYNNRTAERINKEFETKTNGMIRDIIKPDLFDDRSEGVIINAITYGAPWQKAFPADKTIKRSFYGGRHFYQVDTMWTLNNFMYGDVPFLDAKVLELPYQNNDYAMLILLPNSKDGLPTMEMKLAGKSMFDVLYECMSMQRVEVFMPKFRFSFGSNLKLALQSIGIRNMFTRDGDFGNLFRMFVTHYINSFNHKAFIEVKEDGVEQPLKSGGLRNLFTHTYKFEIDHPFVFAIRYNQSIIFMGRVIKNAYF